MIFFTITCIILILVNLYCMLLHPPFNNILQLGKDRNIFLMTTEICARMDGRGFFLVFLTGRLPHLSENYLDIFIVDWCALRNENVSCC
jgi:hypothetical protein